MAVPKQLPYFNDDRANYAVAKWRQRDNRVIALLSGRLLKQPIKMADQ